MKRSREYTPEAKKLHRFNGSMIFFQKRQKEVLTVRNEKYKYENYKIVLYFFIKIDILMMIKKIKIYIMST